MILLSARKSAYRIRAQGISRYLLAGVILIALLFPVSGCSKKAQATPDEPYWTVEDLIGRTYISETDKVVEHSRFARDGRLYVTLVKKSTKTRPGEPPEAPLAPIFYWRIEDGAVLLSQYDDGREPFQRWSLIELGEHTVKFRNSDDQIETLRRER